VGAQPSEKVKVLIKKYGVEGTHLEKQRAALDRLAQIRRRPEPPAAAGGPAQADAAEEEPAADGALTPEPEENNE
jgi:small subunit ribosomal protein S16